MSNSIKKNRIDYMDIFRAFGILLMVMGHIGFGGKFDFFIHAFHMPMFFFVSGFFFKHKSSSEVSTFRYILKKAMPLLIPYVVFGLFHFAVDYFIRKNHSLDGLKELFWINNHELPIAGALWFLTALFFANIIYFLLDRYIGNIYLRGAIIAALAVFGNLAAAFIELPFSLNSAFVGVGLMYIGNLIGANPDKKPIHFVLNLKLIPLVLLAGFSGVLIFLNGYVNMRVGQYAIIPLFWINAVLACIVGINLARYVSEAFSDSVIKRFLTEIGKLSIVFVCLNQLTIMCLKHFNYDKIMCTILTVLILYVVSELISNTPLRIIIGKPVKTKELL